MGRWVSVAVILSFINLVGCSSGPTESREKSGLESKQQEAFSQPVLGATSEDIGPHPFPTPSGSGDIQPFAAPSNSGDNQDDGGSGTNESALWFVGSIGVIGAVYGAGYLITGGDMNSNGIKDSEEVTQSAPAKSAPAPAGTEAPAIISPKDEPFPTELIPPAETSDPVAPAQIESPAPSPANLSVVGNSCSTGNCNFGGPTLCVTTTVLPAGTNQVLQEAAKQPPNP